ncbi:MULTISPECIES: type II toxin-antitoxin system RelB/DinJ family antitoxin [unclassified Campylobacter]|uniref:type II toxin-antitoxin system RelB/DinJ family antitoxin n=1 Tax=unclassified Campylobacter TaxID=2593542 RepID=UPI0022E99C35|nr:MULTISPECIES: type II toxin-antitoxin system RelB/DinJ family antitoxin [unclassified Campylobacter]MDA3048206.1 type II toxin-antitoxin system RelB/DinJ family antitoxin [Campylobacter sp. JMF_08 NE1]MDA3054996.1 type II toxin-antitoxin system RelB/DinJ family antitoxin [Campylobacter sp. VBCF_07 NA4]MDA3060498.1 type II toxin-antitoxin system RelB/DinJ family antitoxin [Campylobacter sp. VBCF_02 NA5]MDA3070236.1 type II toxin-antitoxin system RelB/DinJ family antitoxin [Campylobacter sp. V
MANVSIKVNDQDKKEVEKIFSELGLTISSATNAFFKQVILYNGIPFKLRTKRKSSTISHIPNDEA